MTDLLRVEDLAVSFNIEGGQIEAVRGVSFRIPRGGTVALVGESGSGKSVISQTIMGILPRAARITGGKVLFADPLQPGTVTDIAALSPDGAEMRAIRGGRISIIFQEPMTSLSPIHTVGNQICEALHLHRKAGAAEGRELVTDMLRLVGFPDPAKALTTYPFELSGGLRQRAMIAMALICRPALLIADEPTTALDVTIQAQILKLMRDLQAELGMAVLVITHDLGVVANMAEEIVVLYHGKVMESGTLRDIFERPTHPYLRALLHAVPRFHMEPGERLVPTPPARCSPCATSAGISSSARTGCSAAPTGQSRRSTTSASTSGAASAWAWSARAVAARLPCRRSSCARSSRTLVPSSSTTAARSSTCWRSRRTR